MFDWLCTETYSFCLSSLDHFLPFFWALLRGKAFHSSYQIFPSVFCKYCWLKTRWQSVKICFDGSPFFPASFLHVQCMDWPQIPEHCLYLYMSRCHEMRTMVRRNAKKLITRPIMTVTSPNSTHIALTYTKMRFDNFFDHTYPPSWS